MDLGQLTEKVEQILVGATSDVLAGIHGELDQAQVEAEDRHSFQEMRNSAFVVFDTGNRFVDMPSNWLRSDPLLLPYYVDGSTSPATTRKMEWAPSYDDMLSLYPTTDHDGPPKYVVEHMWVGVRKIFVFPFPDDTYLVDLAYLQRFVSPSDATSDNFFMETMPYYLAWKAASEGLQLLRNFELAAIYAAKAEAQFQRNVRLDKRSKLRGNTLRVQRDANAPFNQEIR